MYSVSDSWETRSQCKSVLALLKRSLTRLLAVFSLRGTASNLFHGLLFSEEAQFYFQLFFMAVQWLQGDVIA